MVMQIFLNKCNIYCYITEQKNGTEMIVQRIESLPKLINFQSAFVDIPEFINEFQVMQHVRELPEAVIEVLEQTSLDWIDGLVSDEKLTIEESIQRSILLREQGNKAFKKGGKENVLSACRYYTKAVFAAPCGSQALSLAHANRAIALQEFGYFQQAYDDCECALEQGYPNNLRHKIITRQAYCARQMEDATLLKLHLDTLQELSLNQNFMAQIEQLQEGLQKLHISKATLAMVDNDVPMAEFQASQKILKTSTEGRRMVAARSIKEGELIFSETAFSFVPCEEWRLCQQCAATQLIPFPCYKCHGKVVYCSIKCRNLHQGTHKYECMAYQKNIFAHIGISHLALRMTLDGLTQIAVILNEKQTAIEIWQAIFKDECSVIQSNNFEYASSLRMITHLYNMKTADQTWFALVSRLMVLYLRKFTTFFNIFDQAKASHDDWELVTASLIYRHIGQLIVNAHACTSFIHISLKKSNPLDFALMADNLWESPYHIRRGYLHQFSDHLELTVANFPYLSICNHACIQSFQPKFSGRQVSAFATKDIKADEEIFNCYTLDYRKSMKKTRWQALRDTYHFDCKCEKCDRENADENYEEFHRYRCENPNCLKIFIPSLPEIDTLNWWETMEDNSLANRLKCSYCQKQLTSFLSLLEEFGYLLDLTDNPEVRKRVLDIFKSLETWLVSYNELKLIYGLEIVTNFYAAHNAGSVLSDDEFLQLVVILKFYLCGTAKKNRINSIEYAVKMTFLWDFIALGKYVCSAKEMQEMLHSIEIVSDEMKKLLMNYYNDFLIPLIKP